MISSNTEQLEKYGKYLSSPSGSSMEPLLRDKASVVEIVKAVHPLKRGDITVHLRQDGTSVLHRIIEVRDGAYLICGDNCVTPELVDQDRVIGVATRFYRNGRWISVTDRKYLLYTRLWCGLFPVRRYVLKIYRLMKPLAGRNK